MPLPFVLDAALATALEARREGAPALVLGPWGSGKTRLLHELAGSGLGTLWPGEQLPAAAPVGGLLVDDVDRVRPAATSSPKPRPRRGGRGPRGQDARRRERAADDARTNSL